MAEYIIITGANGGIGQALSKAFTQSGFKVIASDIHAAPTHNEKVDFYIQADLQRIIYDTQYAHEKFSAIKNRIKSDNLKSLINNAAIQVVEGIENLKYDDWQKTLDINLTSPLVWSQTFLKELENADGCIINISSIHARLTKPNFVAYATSKAALSGLTRSMAVDLGSRVRVNAIEPAAIETEMLMSGFIHKPNLCEQLKDYHPQKRIGTTDEVAHLALNIATDNVRFMHGACIPLDGGISSRLFDPD